jgi:hypothetical protein
MISKIKEQDLVLKPTAYWHMTLKPKLDRLLRRKLAQNRHIRGDDTSVVISVTQRDTPDFTQQFGNIDTDGSVIDKHMIKWGELF